MADVAADMITHLNYTYVGIANDGTCALTDTFADTEKVYPGDSTDADALHGNLNQLRILKTQHSHLATLFVIGGPEANSRFSQVAANADARTKFAESCVEMMSDYGFDGIDIHWESPSQSDAANYKLLLEELRRTQSQLGIEHNREYLLTTTLRPTPEYYRNIELNQIHEHVNWINVKTFDFHNDNHPNTSLFSPLYAAPNDPDSRREVREEFNTDRAMWAFANAGVPSKKLNLSLAFYGRCWQGIDASTDGLYQAHSGPCTGPTDVGTIDFRDIVNNYLSAEDRYWHDQAEGPWLFNEQTGVMVTYDDDKMMVMKAEYVVGWNFGGITAWGLGCDTTDDRLLANVDRSLP